VSVPSSLGRILSGPPPEELISESAIAKRIASLAAEVEASFPPGSDIAFIAIANGATVFAADLMRRIKLPMTFELVHASSYNGGTSSSGSVLSSVSLRHGLKGRNALLIDEILDTGRTLSKLCSELRAFEPASLKTCVLLDKPARRAIDVKADFVGFSIEDEFVVGYGLDYCGYYRNLPYIGRLSGLGE